MLQHQGCDPHVVGRDGSALLAQLPVDCAVMMRGLFVGVEDADAGLQQKAAQGGFVARFLARQFIAVPKSLLLDSWGSQNPHPVAALPRNDEDGAPGGLGEVKRIPPCSLRSLVGMTTVLCWGVEFAASVRV
jgi:hypothetical protein